MSKAERVSPESRLWHEFGLICDCGGRLAGTDSERAACALLEKLGETVSGVACQKISVPYTGWRATRAALSGPGGESLACQPLVRSVATQPGGLDAEVLDLGRGTPEEFEAHASEIPGRIVLVRHELMFAAGTIHRRLKYRRAVEADAAGFLIVGPLEGSVVAGSSGRGDEAGIPAVGIAPETAARFARTSGGRQRAKLIIETAETPAEAANLIFDIPGQTDEWVVLSAHIDGHALAESAIDNASGLAVALAVTRDLAPRVAKMRRGLRLALFNVEEWALTGSAHYVASLSQRERDAIAVNVNLDSIGAGNWLTALTSGFSSLEPFLLEQSEQCGIPLGLYRPLQMNSDHGNFAGAGIPAFRLVSGFNDAAANTRLVLTSGDTRNKVSPEGLTSALDLTRQIVCQALMAPPETGAEWRHR